MIDILSRIERILKYTFIDIYRIYAKQKLKELDQFFFLKTQKTIKKNINGYILCDGMWDNPFHWVRMLILKHAMKYKYGTKFIGLFESITPRKTIEMLRTLTLADEIYINSEVDRSYISRAKKILKKFKNVNQLCNGHIIEDYPGFLFYDSVLKKEKVGQISINNPVMVDYLSVFLNNYFFYKQLIKKKKIIAFYTSHLVHFRYSALVWNLLRKGVPIYCSKDKNRHNYVIRISNKKQIKKPFDDIPTNYEISITKKLQKKRLVSIADKYLNNLFEGSAGESQYFRVFDKKQRKLNRYQFNKIIGANNKKKNIVVMANSWVDFPHQYGNTWYSDLVDWILLTYKVSKKITKFNWIFRGHPAEKWHGSKQTLKKILGKSLHENAYYWPEKISVNQIINCTDFLITARGTSAVEYNSLNHKVLVSTPSPYTQLKFLSFAKNRWDYIKKLNNLDKLKKPSKNNIIKNKIYITCKEADFKHKNFIKYPLNILSLKNYLILPKFIISNKVKMINEINQVKDWSKLKHDRFRTFQVLKYLK